MTKASRRIREEGRLRRRTAERVKEAADLIGNAGGQHDERALPQGRAEPIAVGHTAEDAADDRRCSTGAG